METLIINEYNMAFNVFIVVSSIVLIILSVIGFRKGEKHSWDELQKSLHPRPNKKKRKTA